MARDCTATSAVAIVRAMNEGEGGRGNRLGGRRTDQHSRRQDFGTAPTAGRRTLVEQAPHGVPPVQAKLDGDRVRDRAGGSPAQATAREDRGNSTSSDATAPISIFDLFGPPASLGTNEPINADRTPGPDGDPIA